VLCCADLCQLPRLSSSTCRRVLLLGGHLVGPDSSGGKGKGFKSSPPGPVERDVDGDKKSRGMGGTMRGGWKCSPFGNNDRRWWVELILMGSYFLFPSFHTQISIGSVQFVLCHPLFLSNGHSHPRGCNLRSNVLVVSLRVYMTEFQGWHFSGLIVSNKMSPIIGLLCYKRFCVHLWDLENTPNFGQMLHPTSQYHWHYLGQVWLGMYYIMQRGIWTRI